MMRQLRDLRINGSKRWVITNLASNRKIEIKLSARIRFQKGMISIQMGGVDQLGQEIYHHKKIVPSHLLLTMQPWPPCCRQIAPTYSRRTEKHKMTQMTSMSPLLKLQNKLGKV